MHQSKTPQVITLPSDTPCSPACHLVARHTQCSPACHLVAPHTLYPAALLYQGKLAVRGPQGQFSLQTPNFTNGSWQDLSFVTTDSMTVEQYAYDELVVEHGGAGARYHQCVAPPRSIPGCEWPLLNASELSPPAVTMQVPSPHCRLQCIFTVLQSQCLLCKSHCIRS